MNKAYFWKLFYSKWKSPSHGNFKPGYTLLLPVPGDLPFFLQMAVQICARQNPEHLVETLVIPDNLNSEIYNTFLESQKRWPEGNLRLVKMKKFDSWIIKKINNPGHNHWLQLIRGVDEAKTSHILLHDADLFISDQSFFKNHYEHCISQNLSCCGVSKAWDSWFQEHGADHVVSTWEMIFSQNWIRQFPPWQLHGQDFLVDNEVHTCDTTYYAQFNTTAQEIALHPCDDRWVHFNYVISTYRWFQKSTGTFEDSEFRLLLIRMLHDLFGTNTTCMIPPVDQLALGLTFKDSRVTYLEPETHSHYAPFRAKLQSLLDSDILHKEQCDDLQRMIAPFDDSLA